MFTGIVEDCGRVQSIERRGTSARVTIAPERIKVATLRVGDSVAIDGCCLTVVAKGARGFLCDVSHETLARTTLGGLAVGGFVNLERPLAVGDRLGGHFVLGHVDGVGTISKVRKKGDAWDVDFRVPPEVGAFLIEKGSIAVDGVSLTVNRCGVSEFGVTLIPHTRAVTTLGRKGVGAKVNLEADVLGKYVKRLLSEGRIEGRGIGFE